MTSSIEDSDDVEIGTDIEGQSANIPQLTRNDVEELLVGSAVVSCVKESEKHYVIGLTGGLSLHFRLRQQGISLSINSESGGIWSTPITVISETPITDLGLVAEMLSSINSMHSIIMAVHFDNAASLRALLNMNPEANPAAILRSSARLDLLSIGVGSLIGTFLAQTKESAQALFLIARSISARGRDATLRRWEAEARQADAKANSLESETRRNEGLYQAQIRKAQAEARQAEALADSMDEDVRIKKITRRGLQFEHYKNINEYYEEKIKTLPEGDPIRVSFERSVAVIENLTDSTLLTDSTAE